MSVAQIALALYAGSRHLQASDFGTNTVWARKGIMPGCSLCTKFAKLAVLTAMHKVKAEQESLDISIFIDDIPLSATGARDEVLRTIGSAAEQLKAELGPMGCEIAPEKVVVVGSDHETARGAQESGRR